MLITMRARHRCVMFNVLGRVFCDMHKSGQQPSKGVAISQVNLIDDLAFKDFSPLQKALVSDARALGLFRGIESKCQLLSPPLINTRLPRIIWLVNYGPTVSHWAVFVWTNK